MSEFKTLVKNTSFLAGTRLVQFVASLLRIKISALVLGTFGMGIVDQLMFLAQKISKFTLLGMSEAVVKQIAENKKDDIEETRQAILSSFKSYISLVFLFMLVSIVALILLSSSLTKYLFGDIILIKYFYISKGKV